MFGNSGFGGGRDEPSDLQREILDTARRNPDAGASEIASICECSESHVRTTLKEYGNSLGGGLGFDGFF